MAEHGESSLSAVSAVRMVYLGPEGTYGHQAAKRFASAIASTSDEVELLPCPTIPDIYDHPAEYLVMPLQNVIQGGVIETLDCLLSSLAGPSTSRRPRIIADLHLPIRHSLVAKRGTKMEDIYWVRSHEQALGQSSAFLREHLPRAKQVPWSSTAGAAMSILSESAESGVGSAICSASAIDGIPELEVLYDGTQAIADNYTRFILLTRLSHPPIRFPPRDIYSHFYALDHPSLLGSLMPMSCLKVIHTRPDPSRARPLNDDSDEGYDDQYPHLLLVETRQKAFDDVTGIEGLLFLGSATTIS